MTKLTIDEAEQLLLAGKDVQILFDGTITRGKAPGCAPPRRKTVADWESEELQRMGVKELRAALELNCRRFHNMFDVAETARSELDTARAEVKRLQTQATMACENPCGDCAGCNHARIEMTP